MAEPRCTVTVDTHDAYGRRCFGPCDQPATHFNDSRLGVSTVRYFYCGGCASRCPSAKPLQVLDLGGKTVAASYMRELCDGVEELAGRVLEYRETIELCALIIEGSEEPPSQYEIEVHHRNGGRWLLAADGVVVLLDDCDVPVEARRARPSRWWAIDKTGRPCRRPRSGR